MRKIVFDRKGCTGLGEPCDTLVCTGTGVLASSPLCSVSADATIDMGTVYFETSMDTTVNGHPILATCGHRKLPTRMIN